MIDLYALTSPNVQKVFLMLEECGLKYTTKPVDVWAGEQYKPEFLKINPLAQGPAIVDHDGPAGKPYTVIESGAILIYLAEKTGKFIPHDPVKRYDTLQWLMVQMGNVGPMFGQLVHWSKFAPPPQEYGNARYRSQVHKLYALYEERLASNEYAAGSEYTIADIAAWPWLRNVALLGIDLGKYPVVKKYVEKIEGRDAAKRMLAILPTLKSKRETATDEDKDRFFSRGKFAVA
jgi:GST-like protein